MLVNMGVILGSYYVFHDKSIARILGVSIPLTLLAGYVAAFLNLKKRLAKPDALFSSHILNQHILLLTSRELIEAGGEFVLLIQLLLGYFFLQYEEL